MASDLRIQRLVSRCRVPRGTRAGPALAEALEQGLLAPLERVVATTELQGYWLIRRLDVRTGVGAEWSTAQMATTVAGAIGHAVSQRARRGRDSGEVLWFPDREAFLARLLLDHAQGRAGDRWEYAGFRPLRSWHETAIALAGTEPDALWGALLRLNQGEVDELAERVEGDRLLEVLRAGAGSVGPVLSALRTLRRTGRLAVTGSTGLVLALAAAAETATATLPDVARPALDVAELVRLSAEAGAGSGRLLGAVSDGRWSDVSAVVGPTDTFLPLVQWSEADRAELVDALTTAPDVPGPRMHTRFGGAFLLLPLLPDLWSWSRATDGWPVPDRVGPDRLAKLAVLAAALGTARFDAVLGDPALRIALAIPARLDLREYLASLDPAPFMAEAGLVPDEPVDRWLRPPVADFLGVVALAVLRDLGRRLPGMAGVTPAYLWHNVLDVEAWVSLEETEAVVELGRAPLSVLLSLTGLSRTSFVVEGAGERRWTLTSPS